MTPRNADSREDIYKENRYGIVKGSSDVAQPIACMGTTPLVYFKPCTNHCLQTESSIHANGIDPTVAISFCSIPSAVPHDDVASVPVLQMVMRTNFEPGAFRLRICDMNNKFLVFSRAALDRN